MKRIPKIKKMFKITNKVKEKLQKAKLNCACFTKKQFVFKLYCKKCF